MGLLQKDGTTLREVPSSAHLYLSARAVLAKPPVEPWRLIRPFTEQKEEAVQAIIESALILAEGNRKKAAHCLGISVRVLHYYMKRWNHGR